MQLISQLHNFVPVAWLYSWIDVETTQILLSLPQSAQQIRRKRPATHPVEVFESVAGHAVDDDAEALMHQSRVLQVLPAEHADILDETQAHVWACEHQQYRRVQLRSEVDVEVFVKPWQGGGEEATVDFADLRQVMIAGNEPEDRFKNFCWAAENACAGSVAQILRRWMLLLLQHRRQAVMCGEFCVSLRVIVVRVQV